MFDTKGWVTHLYMYSKLILKSCNALFFYIMKTYLQVFVILVSLAKIIFFILTPTTTTTPF